MLTIYGTKLSRAARCFWTAEELAIEYVQVPLDMTASAHKAPAYLALNPAGKVPTLVEEDFVLTESLAINAYLVSQKQTSLWPQDTRVQARINQWSSWAATEMEVPLTNIIREKRRAAAAGGEADAGFIAAQIAAATATLGLLEAQLAAHPFVAGEAFTLGDINAYTAAMLSPMFLDMTAFPKTTDWLARCGARPAWQRVQGLA